MIVEEGIYKGSKVLTFKKDANDQYPFSFGLAKAKTIMENIEAIQKFVSDNDPNYIKSKPENAM